MIPEISIDEAKHLCNRLQPISEDNQIETDDSRVKLAFGLAELTLGKDETGSDLVERAQAILSRIPSFHYDHGACQPHSRGTLPET